MPTKKAGRALINMAVLAARDTAERREGISQRFLSDAGALSPQRRHNPSRCRQEQEQGMDYGYGRVSTLAQDTALQEDAFRRAGVDVVVTEKWSSIGARPALRRLLEGLQPGDRITVYKLDRMGRSLQDLLAILDRIHRAGAEFRSITEPIDTGNPAGKLMYSILGAVADDGGVDVDDEDGVRVLGCGAGE